MAFDARKKEMLKQFNDNFSAVADAQIEWDGVENKSIDRNIAWISISIQPVTADFASMNSSRKVRHIGFFVVQVFIQPGQTTEAADDIVVAIANALEGKTTTGGVSFRTTRTERVGNNEGYYQLNTFTKYQYDDQRS